MAAFEAGEAGGGAMGIQSRMLRFMKEGNTAAVKELHDSGEWTDLETVVDSGKGADGNTRLWTAMAWAALFKQLGVMRWLVEKGAKVAETREWHQLPSNVAAAAGFIEGLELLKEKGCDLSKADSDGFTPAHCAAREGHLPALRLLHSYGVPMNVKDKDGRTPAYCATKKDKKI